jgi:CubicO group peptidase (beta-lactamase class C family)
LAAPALTAATPESAGFSVQRLQKLDAYMQALVDDGHLPGATVLLARHGKVLSFKTFGKMDVNGAPMTRDAIFRVYSQTKVVTGVAMMVLSEEGKWRFMTNHKVHSEFKTLRDEGSERRWLAAIGRLAAFSHNA